MLDNKIQGDSHRANREGRKSFHQFTGISELFPGCRSFTAANPKNDICNNWNKSKVIVFHSSLSHLEYMSNIIDSPDQKHEVLPRPSINKNPRR